MTGIFFDRSRNHRAGLGRFDWLRGYLRRGNLCIRGIPLGILVSRGWLRITSGSGDLCRSRTSPRRSLKRRTRPIVGSSGGIWSTRMRGRWVVVNRLRLVIYGIILSSRRENRRMMRISHGNW